MSENEIVREHLRNQVWGMLDGLLPDIQRLGEAMTPTNRDEAIVQKTLLGVAGLLYQRRREAAAI